MFSKPKVLRFTPKNWNFFPWNWKIFPKFHNFCEISPLLETLAAMSQQDSACSKSSGRKRRGLRMTCKSVNCGFLFKHVTYKISLHKTHSKLLIFARHNLKTFWCCKIAFSNHESIRIHRPNSNTRSVIL